MKNVGWSNGSQSNWKNRLKFLYWKSQFLDVSFRKLLCNALIQLHFGYVCTAWYPNLTKKLKDKLPVTKNKCIRFCLELQCRENISNELFHKVNGLPINQRFKQCVTSTVFKFLQQKYRIYMNKVFRPAENIIITTRNSFLKLNHAFLKKPLANKTACLILNLLFGTEFQKFWRKPKIWISSSIRWNTTIWMISLIQIFNRLVDLIPFCHNQFSTSFFSGFILIEGPQVRLFSSFVLSLPHYYY